MRANSCDEFAYRIGRSLYLNVTNRCTSACTFCVRSSADGVDGHYLWLSHEPSTKEVLDAVGEREAEFGDRFDEYVFCGYGEPLMRFGTVVDVARALKRRGLTVRLNTNGHGNLINGRNVVPDLAGLVDAVSISMNADTAAKYHEMCNSIYGPDSFGAMLFFAEQCVTYIPSVTMTVVAVPGVDVEACRALAESLGARLRVRAYIDART